MGHGGTRAETQGRQGGQGGAGGAEEAGEAELFRAT